MKRIAVVALLLVAGCGDSTPTVSDTTPVPTSNPAATSAVPVYPGSTPVSGASAAPCSDLGTGPLFTITMQNFSFTPACLKVKAEQGFKLDNKGTAPHNFSITGTQVDLDVQPGEEGNFEAIGGVVKAGTYDFFCKFHKARGMTGKITVTGAFSPGEQ